MHFLKIKIRLTVLFLAVVHAGHAQYGLTFDHGAIIRGDTTLRQVAIVFTGDSFADGGEKILATLRRTQTKASFFLTGNFYRNASFRSLLRNIRKEKHYLGAHSDRHLLYCDWSNRDSLLVTQEQFLKDLADNYREMAKFGIRKNDARFYLPPYEWYNDSIAAWTKAFGLTLINYSPGTLSHADYTTPDVKNYRSSEVIFQSIISRDRKTGLNGFVLLMHIGTDSARTDKFYDRLEELIGYLRERGYELVRVDRLLR